MRTRAVVVCVCVSSKARYTSSHASRTAREKKPQTTFCPIRNAIISFTRAYTPSRERAYATPKSHNRKRFVESQKSRPFLNAC